MNINERLKGWHAELCDYMISAVTYSLAGKDRLATQSEDRAYELIEHVNDYVPEKYAVELRRAMDSKYPECSAKQMINKDLAQVKECYQKMKSSASKIIDSLYPLSSLEEVKSIKRADVEYHVFAESEIRDILTLQGDVMFLTGVSLKASKKIIFNYQKLYCFDAEVTAPDIYLPEESEISSECHLHGDVHYGEFSM